MHLILSYLDLSSPVMEGISLILHFQLIILINKELLQNALTKIKKIPTIDIEEDARSEFIVEFVLSYVG